MKRNPYSRNNIIKTYHKISGLSYKECRANLKANNWDLLKAYGVGLTTAIEGLSEAIDKVVNTMVSAARECFEKFNKALNESIDRVKMANAKDITEDPFTYEIKTTDDPTGEKLNKQIEYYKDLGLIGVDMSSQSDMTVYKEVKL